MKQKKNLLYQPDLTIGSKVINMILENEGVNPKRFAEEIGVTPAQVYDLRSGKTKNISGKFANKILKRYSKYSKAWLMTGDGEVFSSAEHLTEKPELDIKGKHPGNDVVVSREVFDVIKNLSESVLSQQRTIESELQHLRRRIDENTDRNV